MSNVHALVTKILYQGQYWTTLNCVKEHLIERGKWYKSGKNSRFYKAVIRLIFIVIFILIFIDNRLIFLLSLYIIIRLVI